MAKDPAFLFYPGDWLGGTMLLTRHQKGCYIDLLMAQFNSGPLSLDHIKTVLGQDQAMWTVLREKFKTDNSGRFFNEKLATEIEKRKAYTASLANRGQGRKKSSDYSSEIHQSIHTEDVNDNGNKNKGIGGSGEKGWVKDLCYPTDNEDFMTSWANWKRHLAEIKKPYQTFSSEQGALQFLGEFAEEVAIEILKEATRCGWKNLQKPTKKENGKQINNSKIDAVMSVAQQQEQELKAKYGQK